MRNRKNKNLDWFDGSDEDIEEFLAELNGPDELKFDHLGNPQHTMISTRTEMIEVDACGRRFFIIIDDETGQEYREVLPRNIC